MQRRSLIHLKDCQTSMADINRSIFWYFTLKDILKIICVAAVPVALGIYTAITYKQEQQQADQTRQFELQQASEVRQQELYDKFLNDTYTLDKDDYLNDDKKPWAFANAYYRAAHRHWDSIRKADVLQFLKEKQLIGRSNCTIECQSKRLDDIIRLNELNFDNVHLSSQTGVLNRLNLECILFDRVSMTNVVFSSTNLHGVLFNGGRLDNARFDDSSLVCVRFDGTDLGGVDFGNSNLKDAHFSNVNLSTAKLTADQIKQASFFNTTMPDGTPSGTTTKGSTPSSKTQVTFQANKQACSTLVTFDDIPDQSNTSGVIPNGYKNLNWTNAEYINVLTKPNDSEYRKGVVSYPFVMYNPSADNITVTTANSSGFSIESLHLGKTSSEILNVTMILSKAGGGTKTFNIQATSGYNLTCNNCTNIKTMTVETRSGTQFIIDNLCISFEH